MSDPFAWMAGQIVEAVARQEPAGSVALPPGMRSVVACIREYRRPITADELASRALIPNHRASQRIYKAEKAGLIRPVGKKKWQGRMVNLYDLDPQWRDA